MRSDDGLEEDSGPSRKRLRAAAACIPCRDIKTKCVPADQTDSSNRCQRCRDMGLTCTFTPSLRGKSGKGTSIRELQTSVSLLEKELKKIRQESVGGNGGYIGESDSDPLQLHASTSLLSPEMNKLHTAAKCPTERTDQKHNNVLAPSNPHSETVYGTEDASSLHPLNTLNEASMRTFFDSTDALSEAREGNASSLSTDDQHVESAPISGHKKRFKQPLNTANEEPEVILKGILNWAEVHQLFADYFTNCNQHILLLDPALHTVDNVVQRSFFLLTAVCYVSSRYIKGGKAKSEAINEIAMRMAKEELLTSSSVDTVQGLLLLTAWCNRSKKSGDQIAWMLSGAAIRMAIGARLYQDVNCKRRDKQSFVCESNRAETLNRQRTWLMCYAVDRSFSSLTGEPPLIREESLIRNCRSWCQQNDSRPWDAGISCYVDLVKTQSQQFEQLFAISSFQSNTNHSGISDIVKMFNEQLDGWREQWTTILLSCLHRATSNGVDIDLLFLNSIERQLPLRLGHARLVLNSFGLSQLPTITHGSAVTMPLISSCWFAAKDVLYALTNSLGSSMRYSPDTQFIMVAFACVTLLKLHRRSSGHASTFLDKQEVRKIVSDTATSLEQLAVDREHSPALFASFLRYVLDIDIKRDNKGEFKPLQSRVSSSSISLEEQITTPTLSSEATIDSADLDWLIGSDQLLFNNTFLNAPSQACLEDTYWDILLPNVSDPPIGTSAWLSKNAV